MEPTEPTRPKQGRRITLKQRLDKLKQPYEQVDLAHIGNRVHRAWRGKYQGKPPLHKVRQQEGEFLVRVCLYPVWFIPEIDKCINAYFDEKVQSMLAAHAARLAELDRQQQQAKQQPAAQVQQEVIEVKKRKRMAKVA